MPPRKKAAYQAAGNGGGQSTANGSITDVTKELWQAAVNLRGSIEPADYKRYVLPIIFLRFLSLRYEKRRRELGRMIADQKSEYYQLEMALDDPDEYRQVGAFILPPEARWENIRRNAMADDIKVRLDNTLELLENTYPDKLKGLLPRIYAGSNMDRQSVTALINLFSKDIFEADYGGEDLIGRIYEYFIGEFASSEGKRGGEYFTPASIVRVLVAMLEPTSGKVFDPCCGSGGMFVQSDLFTHHSGDLAFYGQETKDFTFRLCRMNLFIHGVDGDIRMGNSYTDDQHASLKARYILANPPFNDGSKGENGWGAGRIAGDDPRLFVKNLTPSPSPDRKEHDSRRGEIEGKGLKMPLSPRNANTMWILHFLHHLADDGAAGFVMATGELSNSETARLEVRKALVEAGYVDCIVQLSGQLFANTQIPCALWFLSKARNGKAGQRERRNEILFIDGRRLGALIPGSRKQKQLSDEDVRKIASVYHEFKFEKTPENIPGFCAVDTVENIRDSNYVLTTGKYVGSTNTDESDEDFEEVMGHLIPQLKEQFSASKLLEQTIVNEFKKIGYEL